MVNELELNFILAFVHFIMVKYMIKPQSCMTFMAGINSFWIVWLIGIYSENHNPTKVIILIYALCWFIAYLFVTYSKKSCSLIQAKEKREKATKKREINKLNAQIAAGCKRDNCSSRARIITIHIIWGIILLIFLSYGYYKK